VAVVLAFKVPFLREVLGLIFILFIPGYALAAAIFPGENSLGKTTRLAVSLGFSIIIGVFVGLILAVTPWGFTLNSLLTAMPVFVIVMSGIAWYLRRRTGQKDKSKTKSSSIITGAVQSFRYAGWGYRCLVIFLLSLLLGGLGSVYYLLARPVPAEPFSEFYVLGTAEKADAYPRNLGIGEEGRVIVGIVNHETLETDYRVRIEAAGAELHDLPDITLKPGEIWEREVGLTLKRAGQNQKVEFFLYTDASVPDETRYIWVNVAE
jgi:uncharacterized membrane protein